MDNEFMPDESTRRYRSERRDRDAERTRRDILASASELFLGRGYARVTVADIARGAGVAAKTVYASVGSKSDVLRELLTAGMAESASGETIESVRRVSTLEEACAHVARGTRSDIERFGPLIDLLEASMSSEDEARRTWDHMLAEYRGALAAVAEDLVDRGLTARGLDARAVTDRLWLCFGLSAWRTLVVECRWDHGDAETLLARQAVAALG
jgi:AcrR family transcriptional regulator